MRTAIAELTPQTAIGSGDLLGHGLIVCLVNNPNIIQTDAP
jgi:hypothetical protein